MKTPRIIAALLALSIPSSAAEPPLDLGQQHASTDARGYFANAAVTIPDGAIESFFRRGTADGVAIFRIRSTDHPPRTGGRGTTSTAVSLSPALAREIDSLPMHLGTSILTHP